MKLILKKSSLDFISSNIELKYEGYVTKVSSLLFSQPIGEVEKNEKLLIVLSSNYAINSTKRLDLYVGKEGMDSGGLISSVVDLRNIDFSTDKEFQIEISGISASEKAQLMIFTEAEWSEVEFYAKVYKILPL